jgi:hypothetical protein
VIPNPFAKTYDALTPSNDAQGSGPRPGKWFGGCAGPSAALTAMAVKRVLKHVLNRKRNGAAVALAAKTLRLFLHYHSPSLLLPMQC